MKPADLILQKALAASSIPTSQWEKIRADLRNRAFFIARVESARFLYEAHQAAHDAVGHALRADGAGHTEADAIERIRSSARTLAGELKHVGEGGLLDPSSFQRAKLILETQGALAAGYVRHLADIQPGALAAFPAKELFRPAYSRPQTPRNWLARWQQAGGKIYSGRMIALATDPVWSKISRFGNPYPPFDFNSGMETRAVSRSECIALGVMAKDAPPPSPPPAASLNAGLQAEVNIRHDSQEAKTLLDAFGDQATFNGDVFKWRGELIRDVIQGKVKSAKLGRGFDGRNLRISHNFFAEHLSKHYEDNEMHPRGIPLTNADYELLPTIWRSPDKVVKSRGRDVLELDAMDGGLYRLVVDPVKGIRSFYKTEASGGAKR